MDFSGFVGLYFRDPDTANVVRVGAVLEIGEDVYFEYFDVCTHKLHTERAERILDPLAAGLPLDTINPKIPDGAIEVGKNVKGESIYRFEIGTPEFIIRDRSFIYYTSKRKQLFKRKKESAK